MVNKSDYIASFQIMLNHLNIFVSFTGLKLRRVRTAKSTSDLSIPNTPKEMAKKSSAIFNEFPWLSMYFHDRHMYENLYKCLKHVGILGLLLQKSSRSACASWTSWPGKSWCFSTVFCQSCCTGKAPINAVLEMMFHYQRLQIWLRYL